MALELITGAVLGAAAGELLKAVLDAKDKATNFNHIFKSLESTLQLMVPRVNRLSRLNQKLNLPQDDLKEFIANLTNGEHLVRKSLKISNLNFVRKVQYSKELLDLDNSLLRYLQTILILDQAGDTKEILVVVRELRMLLKGDKDETIDNQASVSAPTEISSKDESIPIVPKKQDSYQMSQGKAELPSQDSKKKRFFKCWWLRKKKPTKMEDSSRKEDGRTEDLDKKEVENKLVWLEGCPYSFSVEDLLTSDAEVLGKGTYGTTYRVSTGYGEIVVKRLRNVKVGEIEFRERIKHLRKVGQHPNIMPPLGFYCSKDEWLLLYDYAPGNLYALLHGNSNSERSPLDWDSRLKITSGAARGILHLHSEGCIHGNLKSSNVLLTRDREACISEYGLVPLMSIPAGTSQEAGYRAPEIIKTGEITEKSDVYSFGVMLLEILTGKPAIINLPHWIQSVVREEWTEKVFDPQLLQLYEHNEDLVEMLQIAMSLTATDPKNRPKMDEVVRMMESIRSSP